MKPRSKANRNAQRSPSFPRAQPQGMRGARQKYEHYLALARAEDGNGDHIAAENYYQYAEHYFRSAAGADRPAQSKL